MAIDSTIAFAEAAPWLMMLYSMIGNSQLICPTARAPFAIVLVEAII